VCFRQQHKRLGHSRQQPVFLICLEGLREVLPEFTDNQGQITPIPFTVMIVTESGLDRPTKSVPFSLQQFPGQPAFREKGA